MLSGRCLSVLSVCDVGVFWPNGWMDQDETWHGGRPRPRPHRVRWGPSTPKWGTAPPQFSAYVYIGRKLKNETSGVDQDPTWYEGRSRSKPHCLD